MKFPTGYRAGRKGVCKVFNAVEAGKEFFLRPVFGRHNFFIRRREYRKKSPAIEKLPVIPDKLPDPMRSRKGAEIAKQCGSPRLYPGKRIISAPAGDRPGDSSSESRFSRYVNPRSQPDSHFSTWANLDTRSSSRGSRSGTLHPPAPERADW